MPAWYVGGAIALVASVLVVWQWLRPPPARTEPPTSRAWQPLPRRVEVEVLNSGGLAGAGRAGMFLLRRAGLDVVLLADAEAALRGHDRNQVLVRRRDTTGVGRVVEALGDAEVVVMEDADRLVDLTVLLGRRFRVPKGH